MQSLPTPVLGVILAAGKGTRMKSATPKVLHKVCGVPIIERVYQTLKRTGVQEIGVVLGKETAPFAEFLQSHPQLTVCIQEEQKGTADAVAAIGFAFSNLKTPPYARGKHLHGPKLNASHVLICYGDTPALSSAALCRFIQECLAKKSKLGVIAMRHPEPTGYGRLLLDTNQNLLKIVEEKDADAPTKAINLCNTGLVFAEVTYLFDLLSELQNTNAQNEYYLTDCFAASRAKGQPAFVFISEDYRTFDGVNDPTQLRNVESWLLEKGPELN